MEGYRQFHNGHWREFLNQQEIMTSGAAYIPTHYWPMFIWHWRRNNVNNTIEVWLA